MRIARVCALSRIHVVITALMTLACDGCAHLASVVSDLQGVARQGTATSKRNACDARAQRCSGRVVSGGSVHVVRSRQFTPVFGAEGSPSRISRIPLLVRAALRARRRRRAPVTAPCSSSASRFARGGLRKKVPRRYDGTAVADLRPDAKQGMRRGSCATKDQGCLS